MATEEPSDTTSGAPVESLPETTVADPWYRSEQGVWTVALYVLLALAGAAVTTETVLVDVLGFDAGVGVPLYVYLYGLLGALAYVFTSVLDDLDRSTERVYEAGLRIPAALMLAAGVYLLAGVLVGPDTTNQARLAAGLAFLAGLYVKLTLRTLGAVADGLYRGVERRTDRAGEEDADDEEGEPGSTRNRGSNRTADAG